MFRSQCLLALFALSIGYVNSWDIALTTGDQIEFYSDGKTTDDKGVKSAGLTALAYDAVHNMLLFVDKQSDNASIFGQHLTTNKLLPLVRRKIYEDIQGLAFDPISKKLFWTDKYDKSIYWKSLKPGSKDDVYGKLLFKFDNEIPRAIAVDSCRGYIYWTNINISKPTIERARLDGSDRQVVVNSGIFMPVSITIDQKARKIYWADDKEGIHYSIESADLDGKNQETVVLGTNHSPNALAVSKDNLYWIDWGYSKVWKLPKTTRESKDKVEPVQLFSFVGTPFGIVANYSIADQTEGIEECQALHRLSVNQSVINDSFDIPTDAGVLCLHGVKVPGKSECKCSRGYTGERCEMSVCQNYCLHGECSVTPEGQAKCSCKEGFAGARCEVDICNNRCLNNGRCVVKESIPVCQCIEDFKGERCEIERDNNVVPVATSDRKEESCNCSNNNTSPKLAASENLIANDGDFVETCNNGWDPLRDPIIMVLGTLSGLLCVACAFLITKVLQLKKRPRIKKRIIVQKNSTPLTARPDQCEITIENCCNMNICETVNMLQRDFVDI
ncbi:protein cueball isoform X2 [Pectinophora gossypiella]|uniref:protein cueball isoform X2 n=1 Tax=Pectinophora gossypiella TaxID=13191 RepID=UPI00214E279A|nr:protein cueball isoform X2 [Pectinophora gossypiella]